MVVVHQQTMVAACMVRGRHREAIAHALADDWKVFSLDDKAKFTTVEHLGKLCIVLFHCPTNCLLIGVDGDINKMLTLPSQTERNQCGTQ